MSKLIQYLKDKGLNDKTSRQYYVQINKFLVDNNIKDPKKFAEKTDKEILDMAEAYCNDNKKVYIRKYTMIKLFQYLDRIELETEFRKRIKKKLKLKDSSKGDRALSIEELKSVIEEVPYKYGLMIKLMFWGGFRINEILKLKRNNLKQIDNKIRITVKGKGDKKIVAFIVEDVSKELIIYTNKVCGKDKNKLLFDMTYEHFDYVLRKATNKLGLVASSHDVGKRTRANWELLKKKTPLNRIKVILHHSDISTTLRYLSDSGAEAEKLTEEREGLIEL